jgi:hypothetical protein
MIKVKESLFEYCQTPDDRFQFTIDLFQLFPISEDRESFKGRLKNFKGYTIDAEKLIYDSEQLIPIKKDGRPLYCLF